MKNMKKQLIELLNIHGVSGKEMEVRNYLRPVLSDLMDMVVVDSYGNLLGEKVIGTGIGSTILLSAHMDTVKGVLADRELVIKSGIIKSSKGALGADDRAGIAIILSVLRNINKISTFNGVIKVAFSREEEIGCVGSEKIDSNWYKDVDLAIVVDRCGNRDIVVGCGMAFCSDSVGYFMEDVSKIVEMNWKCVEGGVSDAMTFATKGVNSINLSAGYSHEHTDREFVSISDMKDTIRLIMQVFAVVNNFSSGFGDVKHENHWVKAWFPKDKKSQKYYDSFEDSTWAEEYDQHGNVYVYEIGADYVIQQNDSEIILSRDSLKSIISQLGRL